MLVTKVSLRTSLKGSSTFPLFTQSGMDETEISVILCFSVVIKSNLHLRNYPSDNRVMNILRQRTTDVEVKKYCISLLEDAGSFKYSLQVLEDLDSQIRSEIEKLGGNAVLMQLMDELKNWQTPETPAK